MLTITKPLLFIWKLYQQKEIRNEKYFSVNGSGISSPLDQDKFQEDLEVKYSITALWFSLIPNIQGADSTVHHKMYILYMLIFKIECQISKHYR